MNHAGNLHGKVFIVTGAASGIGAATVRLIEARGGVAVATDLAGTDVKLDVTEPADWDVAIAATLAEHGRIDGLVSNAGIASSGALVDLDLEDFRRSSRVHVEGAFIGIQKIVAQLRVQSSPALGSIVVVASVMAAQAAPNVAAYAATKAGLSNMARAIGVELGRKGDFIRVNVVAPGPVATPMLRAVMPAGSVDSQASWTGVPLRRPSEADEIAETIVYLLSEDSSFMTASVTTVDGGWSLT
ncbi:SDR family oxidoreductase [Sphingosinicellaceae bacterium]|nr:SDR family oxidoreductase [Sphingosinicellaceae bacterium]